MLASAGTTLPTSPSLSGAARGSGVPPGEALRMAGASAASACSPTFEWRLLTPSNQGGPPGFQQDPGDRRCRGNGQGLTEIPVAVGARAFGSGEPMRQQHE